MNTGYALVGDVDTYLFSYDFEEMKQKIEKWAKGKSYYRHHILEIENNKPIRVWKYGVSNIRFVGPDYDRNTTKPEWFSREINK